MQVTEKHSMRPFIRNKMLHRILLRNKINLMLKQNTNIHSHSKVKLRTCISDMAIFIFTIGKSNSITLEFRLSINKNYTQNAKGLKLFTFFHIILIGFDNADHLHTPSKKICMIMLLFVKTQLLVSQKLLAKNFCFCVPICNPIDII